MQNFRRNRGLTPFHFFPFSAFFFFLFFSPSSFTIVKFSIHFCRNLIKSASSPFNSLLARFEFRSSFIFGFLSFQDSFFLFFFLFDNSLHWRLCFIMVTKRYISNSSPERIWVIFQSSRENSFFFLLNFIDIFFLAQGDAVLITERRRKICL